MTGGEKKEKKPVVGGAKKIQKTKGPRPMENTFPVHKAHRFTRTGYAGRRRSAPVLGGKGGESGKKRVRGEYGKLGTLSDGVEGKKHRRHLCCAKPGNCAP